MVKIRKVCKAGITAKFARGRFSITHHRITEFVMVETVPRGDSEIMRALEAILDQF